ncbi:MAG: sulfatase-like hydrolase/transferase [Armatimonadota bacterium]|nr:sulfatase-like hydrolase/transferase [Armatimonadota bacterium]
MGYRLSLTRREFLALLGAGSAGLALGDYGFAAENKDKKPPNIVLIVADDLGYGELGCQGNAEIPTPNIDSIAASGVRFTSGYVSCPVCSPTRAGLITGRYQQRFGHEFNPGPQAAQNFGLPLSETTLASRLKSTGYKTGMVGKWHLGSKAGYTPLDRGFDEFFGFLLGGHPYLQPGGPDNPILRGAKPVEEKEYLTDAFAREAKAFIEKHKKETFFLYLTPNAVHSPMQATKEYLSRFPTTGDQKRRTFSAMLSALDDAVGDTLKALRDNNLEENTLVFFISDNGGPTAETTSGNGPLNGHKGGVRDGGIRVPFMMQWKNHLPAGVVSDTPVISLDIAPTALAAAAAKVKGAKFDGVNLLPYLGRNSRREVHDALYWRFGNQYAIRQGDWKLAIFGKNAPELYNLAEDIGEKTDLAAQKPDKVKELREKLMQWDSKLAKPLWQTRRAARPAGK